MSETTTQSTLVSSVYTKQTLIHGKPTHIRCVEIGSQTFAITEGPLAIVSLEDEWYEDLADPTAIISALEASPGLRPDLLTFWQRMPDIQPIYPFHLEWEDIAVLPITSYEDWWKNRINSKTRNMIRKAEKEGVTVRETRFDDDFVTGMTRIFNEQPFRQGRRFWHYGKDHETVKKQFSRFLFRERMIGAYFEGEMVGFVMLGDAGRFGLTGQVISSIKHRNKSPNNALIAKAIDVCAQRHLPYLIYYFWSDDSLSAFKRHCGFEKTAVPRYFVPLSWKGELALKCGAHRGWKAMLPAGMKNSLKRVRSAWYGLRAG